MSACSPREHDISTREPFLNNNRQHWNGVKRLNEYAPPDNFYSILHRKTVVILRREYTWIGVNKGKLLGLKSIGNAPRHAVDYPKREPQVGSGMFGIRLLILHFKFQFSKSIKSSTFHIFLNLTYTLRKNISFPKCPKFTQKFTQNHQTEVNEISRQI